jgi:hypothetical protein
VNDCYLRISAGWSRRKPDIAFVAMNVAVERERADEGHRGKDRSPRQIRRYGEREVSFTCVAEVNDFPSFMWSTDRLRPTHRHDRADSICVRVPIGGAQPCASLRRRRELPP